MLHCLANEFCWPSARFLFHSQQTKEYPFYMCNFPKPIGFPWAVSTLTDLGKEIGGQRCYSWPFAGTLQRGLPPTLRAQAEVNSTRRKKKKKRSVVIFPAHFGIVIIYACLAIIFSGLRVLKIGFKKSRVLFLGLDLRWVDTIWITHGKIVFYMHGRKQEKNRILRLIKYFGDQFVHICWIHGVLGLVYVQK